jgi:leader peptidase (prepilin peptidase)/N-methyltransferase
MQVDPTYVLGYVIFISLLIIITRTDLEHMLIVPEFCLYPIIIAFFLAYIGVLPIDLMQSIIGALVGYFSLWSIAKIYYSMTNRHGLGEGDFDLFALIGAFTGVHGLITSLLIGSWSGSIVGVIYLMITNHAPNTRIPFAPFLALGAVIHVLFQQTLYQFFLCLY